MLILTGAGDRAFCAGNDLRETSEARLATGSAEPPPLPYPLNETLDLWKPTIAALNGYTIAGGFALAMQCDIRIAAEQAEIGIAETR